MKDDNFDPKDPYHWQRYNEMMIARNYPTDKSDGCKICGKRWGDHVSKTYAKLHNSKYHDFQ